MSNPLHHFWLFVYAVGDHVFTLLAGCALTVVINLIEKYALGGKRLPLKVDIGILLFFVFFASFEAWRDQYEKASKVLTPPVQITNQINVPPINVPPAQVIVSPSPASPQSHDLTGFMELAKTDMVTRIIAKDSPIEVNVGYIVKGTQQIHGATYITSSAVGTLNPDRNTWDENTEKESEEALWKAFSGQIEKAKKEIVQTKFKGHTLGVGNVIIYRTASSSPLTETQVKGIINGRTRLYLMSWATWKDSNNRSGDTHVCLWMQAPPSLDLSTQQIVWHECTWIP